MLKFALLLFCIQSFARRSGPNEREDIDSFTSSSVSLTSSVSLPPSSIANLRVDWPSFLARSDPMWSWSAYNTTSAGRPDEWVKSLFGGNAMLGFMIFHDEGDNIVRIAISRADLYDDRTLEATPNAFMNNFVYDRPRLPVGSFRITFSSTVVNATGRLVLYDARAEYTLQTSVGSVSIIVWACSDVETADVIVIEAASSGSEQASVEWVPAIAQSTWSGRDPKYTPNMPPRNSSASSNGGILNITTQTHLRGTAHSTAVWQGVISESLITFVSISPVLSTGSESDLWASKQVLAAQSAGLLSLRNGHEAWWHSEWPKGGSLFLDYSVLEELFYVQIYKYLCAARRGRAFMDLMGPWFIDETNAPDVHFDWNIQGMYYLPFAAGRLDIANSLIDYMQGLSESGVLSSQHNVPYGWDDSAAAPAGASALDGEMSCYWEVGPNCTSAPPTVTGNLLWILHVMQQTAAFSGNTTIETDVIFPLISKAIRFYVHFIIDNGTVISLPSTFSPEYPARGPNANYDVSLLHWALQYALDLTARFNLTSPDIPLWEDMRSRLVSFQFDPVSDTFTIYTDVPLSIAHRHFSHLLMIWPLHTLDLTQPVLFNRALKSVDLWSSMPELDSLFGRPSCMSMNTLLKRPAAGLDNLTFMLHTRIEGSGWYREPPGFGGQTVCNEATYMAAYALIDALLQSHNTTTLISSTPVHILEFFPFVDPVIRLNGSAYDSAPAKIALASFYKLPTEGAFLASAMRSEFLDGRCPPELLCTYTAWVVIDSPPQGGPLVLRLSDMPRPLASYPEGINLTELGDGGLVQVELSPGSSVAIFSGSMNPPESFDIAPRIGCPQQYNYFGGRSVSAEEGLRTKSTATATVILTNCTTGPDGIVSPTQRWSLNTSTPNTEIQLLDGTTRCLSLASCSGGEGSQAVLLPCGSGSGPSPSGNGPLGCEDPSGPNCLGLTQNWIFSNSPINSLKNTLQGQCLELHGGANPNDIDVWGCQTNGVNNMVWMWNATSGALTSCATCCFGMCLTAIG